MEAVLRKVEAVLGLEVRRLGPLVVSFAVAELFFKFGSFALECLAFLALWRALDWGGRKALGVLGGK